MRGPSLSVAAAFATERDAGYAVRLMTTASDAEIKSIVRQGSADVPESREYLQREVINIFALAIRQGLSARQLEDTIFAYPTSGSDIAYML